MIHETMAGALQLVTETLGEGPVPLEHALALQRLVRGVSVAADARMREAVEAALRSPPAPADARPLGGALGGAEDALGVLFDVLEGTFPVGAAVNVRPTVTQVSRPAVVRGHVVEVRGRGRCWAGVVVTLGSGTRKVTVEFSRVTLAPPVPVPTRRKRALRRSRGGVRNA